MIRAFSLDGCGSEQPEKNIQTVSSKARKIAVFFFIDTFQKKTGLFESYLL